MFELALIPIGMLPGIGLLILSTSNRYWTVVSDLLGMGAEEAPRACIERYRARLFRNALVSLYAAVACASTSALAGSLLNFLGAGGEKFAAIGSALAIACVVYASAELIRESVLSLRVVAIHQQRQQNMKLAKALEDFSEQQRSERGDAANKAG